MRSICQSADAVRVTADSAEGPHELSASVVVVADGVRSRFRDEVGAGVAPPARDAPPMPWQTRAMRHRTHVPCCTANRRVSSSRSPSRAGAGDGWCGIRGAVSSGSIEDFRAAIQMRTGIDLELAPDLKPASFVAAQHTATRLHRGRIVLLGDAAHEVSPIGGQGMNLDGWMPSVSPQSSHGCCRAGPPTSRRSRERRTDRWRGAAPLVVLHVDGCSGIRHDRARQGTADAGARIRAAARVTAGLLTMRGL